MIEKIEEMTGLRLLLLSLTYVGTLEWVGKEASFVLTLLFSLAYIALSGVIILEGYRVRLLKKHRERLVCAVSEGYLTPNEARDLERFTKRDFGNGHIDAPFGK